MTDKELIEKVIHRDEAAFRELFEKYQQIVFKTCLGFLHNRDDADDIVQEVFIEVYQSIARFRNESKISTWLYRIAVNKSLNHLKKNRKNSLLLSIENIFSDGSEKAKREISNISENEMKAEKEESAKILYESIESLPSNQKIAFTLHKYDDLSYKEISDVMDMSLSAVESLIHRAKLNLQTKLIKYFDK